jgi:hypothetical protein
VGRTIWHIRSKNPNHEAKVQIEKKQNHSTPSSFAAKSSGTKVAQEYAATFPTRLALARWTRGGDIPHVHCFEHQLPMRAAWYEHAQRRFQAWLEAGGFHEPEPGCLDSVIAEAPQEADKNPVLSREVVVHGGPRSASRPSDTSSGDFPSTSPARHAALDANGPALGGNETPHRQDTSAMTPSSRPGLQSFSTGSDGTKK